ncbi:MAG: DUF2085 domain-containing protein [Anaerolineales bacterium]|nr:DUF2085 domain-containing protein [Anaerolineales bacterium]
MIEVKLYSRANCDLCEQTKNDLSLLQERYPHRLVLIDIDANAELQRKFGFEIPVVQIGPYTLKAPFSFQELQMTLGAAHDRERHIGMIQTSPVLEDAHTKGVWTRSDRVTLWLARHYLAMFNLLVIIYLGLPFLAPVLMRIGAEAPAKLIYRGYSMVCHQLAFRSFFLFGEQVVYPRAAAGVEDLLSYGQATGLGEGSTYTDIYTAEKYIGNSQMGYKVALCQRDVAIYGGILLFGLIFALLGRRLPAMPWYLWLLLGLGPIGLDGVSQVISQPPLSFIPFRESTPILRVVTGGLFGYVTAWYGYVMVEETMRDTRQILEAKLKRTLQT